MSENDSFYDLRGSCIHFSQSGVIKDKNRNELAPCISSLTSNSCTTLELKSPSGWRPQSCREKSKRMPWSEEVLGLGYFRCIKRAFSAAVILVYRRQKQAWWQ